MSYRTAYTRQVSLACAPGRNRLDRVLQAGELLHRLKLRGDPFDTGPSVVARLESNRPNHLSSISLVFLDVLDLDTLIEIRQLALASKEWNAAFNKNNNSWDFVIKRLVDLLTGNTVVNVQQLRKIAAYYPLKKYSIYDIYNLKLNWEDAINLLRSTIPTADEDTLKKVAIVVLNIDDVDLLNGNTGVNVQQLRKIATYYPLTQKPFDIFYKELESTDELFMGFMADYLEGTEGGEEVTKALSAAMKVFSTAISNGALATLQFLFLPCNQIGDEEMRAFSTALESGALPSLTKLWLPNNNIGDKGMKAFSTALSSGSLASLKDLRLFSNKIGDEGMKAFSSALSSGALASVESLNLDHNQIGDEGVKAFSTALSSGSLGSLRILMLQGNLIDFVDALKNGALPSLREIRVNNEPSGTHKKLEDALAERHRRYPSLITITVKAYQ
jgi:Leucine-rich repeat (LRR) protein